MQGFLGGRSGPKSGHSTKKNMQRTIEIDKNEESV